MTLTSRPCERQCAALDATHLQVIKDIADRAPAALWSVGTADHLSALFRNQDYAAPEQLEASVGALTSVGIAYEKAKRVAASDRHGGGKSDDVEQALLAQCAERCTSVDAHSPPSRLGQLFLPGMLQSIVRMLPSSANDSDAAKALSACVSHLSACADQCPSLLAGEESTLMALLRACMSIAQLTSGADDEEVAFLKLSALDALATLTAVPQIKRCIMKPVTSPSPRSVGQAVEATTHSNLLTFLLQGTDAANGGENGEMNGVLYQCALLAVTGVDHDEQAWASDPAQAYDTGSSWDDDQTALHAESLLESFVENLGGKSTLPAIFQMVGTLLASQDWRNHRAVLSLLERCLAAAPATFVPHVPATVDAALRLMGTTCSVRVQHQALQLLGSLCCADSVDEGEGAPGPRGEAAQKVLVREKYGRAILEAVSRLIGSPCTKVASHACLTVVSYCRSGNGSENCLVPVEKSLIVPYVGNLLDALRSGPLSVDMSNPNSVDEGSLTVLLRAIGAVACLADVAGEDFLPHYGVMSGLTACTLFGLQRSGQTISLASGVTNTHEMATLRGAAIEAASIVGAAIAGPEGENIATYVNDASEIMSIAITLLGCSETTPEVMIPMDQLLAACARIATVMKGVYVQFLPSVLPYILKRATEKLEVSITDDADNAKDANDECSEGFSVSIPGMGAKKVTINTTQLEEKAQSARATYEHARALGEDFGPFVEASATAFLPLLHCDYSGEVRSTSAQALCQIFKSACLAAAANDPVYNAQGPAQALLPVLARALTKQLTKEHDEDDIEIRFAIADSLSEVMWDSHTHKAGNGEHVAQVTFADARENVCCQMSLISACLSRRSKLLSEMADYSFDNDEIARCEQRADAESDYLTHLVDSVGYNLKLLGDSFAPIFAEFVAGPMGQALTTNAGTKTDIRARLSAVCLFDDCVEHCGPVAADTYAPMLLEAVREALDMTVMQNEGDVDLKKAAVYGLAQIARHAPKGLPLAIGQDILSKLYEIAKEVTTVPKEDLEHVALVENTVSAIASLVLFSGSPLFGSVSDKGALMNVFLHCLPLEEDFDEAKVRVLNTWTYSICWIIISSLCFVQCHLQICHDGLCDLVESNMVNVQSEYRTLLRITSKVLVLLSEGDDIATGPRLMGVISKIQQTVDGNSIQAAFSALEPEAQEALASAMQ